MYVVGFAEKISKTIPQNHYGTSTMQIFSPGHHTISGFGRQGKIVYLCIPLFTGEDIHVMPDGSIGAVINRTAMMANNTKPARCHIKETRHLLP